MTVIRKQRISTLLLMTCGLLLLWQTGCSEKPTTFVNQRGRFKIQIPPKWSIKKKSNNMVIAVGPDFSAENMTMISAAALDFDETFLDPIHFGPDDQLQLDAFFQTMLAQRMEADRYARVSNFKLLAMGEAQIDGRDAKWIEYTCDKQPHLPAKVREYFLVDRRIGYVIELAAAENLFQSTWPALKKSLDSFRIIND